MLINDKKPEVIVFAGPNGSGKSTFTTPEWIIEPYINADDIERELQISTRDAAMIADERRQAALDKRQSFSFETVLSTDRKLKLLRNAKDNGYFLRGYFVLTFNPKSNVARVKARALSGLHDVPEEKIISRYYRS